MFHYEGSLTTPGCAEIVQWIVMDTPMYIRSNGLVSVYLQIANEMIAMTLPNKIMLYTDCCLKKECRHKWGCNSGQLPTNTGSK